MSALDGTGSQFTELPPRGRPRLSEYPVNYGYFMRDPHARVTQFGMEVVATFNPNARITQFGLEVIVALRPQGAQLSGNAPAGRLRSVDYSFTPPLPLTLATLTSIPIVTATSTASTELPPRGPARSTPDNYYGFDVVLPNLLGQDTLLPYHSTDATALPPRGPARSTPDNYNFTAAFFHGLDGQDAMVAGDQLSGNTPPGALRASTLTDPGANYVIYVTAPLPPNPRFTGGQSTDLTALYPRAAARAVDYTWLRSLPIHLIGQDTFAPGEQYFDLPPRGPLRARDYTWLYTLPAQFPPPAPPLPPGKQLFVNTPDRQARIRGEYPSIVRGSLPLLVTPVVGHEQFQAILFI